MAGSYLLPARHFEFEHCAQFLQSRNSAEQMQHPSISRYKTFITSGPDTELLRFQSSLLDHDVKKILIYLRNFKICDRADCERINNGQLWPTSDLMVAELVQMVSTKDPHAFWYFIHSVKFYRGRDGLFEFFHGNINCCVCEEVEAKENEISPFLSSEGGSTTFPLQAKWPKMLRFWQEKLAKDLKKEVKRRKQKIEANWDDFWQEVGPSILELKISVRGYVAKAFESKDLRLSAALKRSKQKREESQPLPEVVIPINIEQSEQLIEVCECSCSEEKSKPDVRGEEAGYDSPTKGKLKSKFNCEASVATFYVIEGRKKYVAFVFACLTLYQYVDSLIRFIPF